MLEVIIVILPGVLTFGVYRYLHREFSWKKLLFYILFYTVADNFCILAGLKLIGMQKFNLFEMGVRFKIKWMALEVVLSALFIWSSENIRKLNPYILKQRMRRLFPTTLFFVVTCTIFTPSLLFLENINEFCLHYYDIIPVILSISFILAIGVYIVSLFLLNEKILFIYIAFIFSISLSAYVQGNFLNSNLPILDGTEVNWAAYSKENMISVCFWILCTILCLVSSCLWKEKMEKGIKYIACFLSAVQMVSLVILLFSTKIDKFMEYGYSKEGEFAIGLEKNIVIFVIDSLQADTMQEYLMSDVYIDGALNDFTFFDNTVAGGAPTSTALPVILTGMEYDPMQNLASFATEMWNETEFYNDLHSNGFDIRFYTTRINISDPPNGIIDNFKITGSHWIGDYSAFSFQMYKLTGFYLMPQFLKQYFWISDNAISDTISLTDNSYEIDDVQFYEDFKQSGGLQSDYKKTFRLYHLRGVHSPYFMNENIKWITDGSVAEQQTLRGNMKILYEYIDEMKNADVYNASTIIILGDHGRHEEGNLETNPAVLLKLPYESHELMTNSRPIHFRNLIATMAGTFLDDYSVYGPSVYDISEYSDVERLHTIEKSIRERVVLGDFYDDSLFCTRFIIDGKADGGNYKVWNPYEINCISYQIGDIIDFNMNNDYAKKINYRLYKENGAATASNELSICFELENYEKEDLELHFIYSNIYNDSQKIRIYANGNKVENVICTRENIGHEMISEIPTEYCQDGELVIRMVFPNAVTPNQLDRSNIDMRILSVVFDSMWLKYK